ncbi:uncharacterized protein (DUF2249 family) [Cryobacterium mesophilum]|uniref:DUF2249 domain-containing protein n=1 Tax=Terrimesophilobacter mesophilus TaxID=433647 RepID=A0A4R8VDH6_9MICO|nr:DUF2249 domain-containing protein [Terrimesophilobacter mesophilus]MBB5633481.1 uncharacterized protein (DUF2249 family) [Terrimesophilobacter mesophilus]TFB80192.1 DUF2249 domain-containing protein [Terrimesophilobacter mesophilus]
MTAEPIDLQRHAPSGTAHSGCACGQENESEIVLDVRQIPHAIRHATIFGALGSIAPGISIDLVADHNPLPLLAQLEQREPGRFSVSYLTEGPEIWTLHITRQHAA